MQKQIPYKPQAQPDLVDLPSDWIAMCNSYRDAVRICMKHSRVQRSEESWADLLGMSRGNLNWILNGGTAERKRNMDADLFEVVELAAGNRAISQYFDMQSKGLLNRQRRRTEEEELEELRKRVSDLEQKMKESA